MLQRKKLIFTSMSSLPPEILTIIFRYLDNHTILNVIPYVNKLFNCLCNDIVKATKNELHRIMHTCFQSLYQNTIQPNQTMFKHIININQLNRINHLKNVVKNYVFGKKTIMFGDFLYQEFFLNVVNSFKCDLKKNHTPSGDIFYFHYLFVQVDSIKKLEKKLDKLKIRLNRLIGSDENRQQTTIILFCLQNELEMIKDKNKNKRTVDILKKTRDNIISSLTQDQIHEYREYMVNIHHVLQSNSIKTQLMKASFPKSSGMKQYRMIKIVGKSEALISTIFTKLITSFTLSCQNMISCKKI